MSYKVESEIMSYDYLVDASGENCPMPLLKTKLQLNKMTPGECVKVIATDATSVRDFSSFIALTANELREDRESDGTFVYYIVKR